MKGTVVSLRDKLGLHTGWLVRGPDGAPLGEFSHEGTRGGAERSATACLTNGRKIKLGDLHGDCRTYDWEAK